VLSVGVPSFAQRGPTGLHGVTGSVGSVVYPAGAPGTPGVIRTGSSVVNPGGGGVHLTVPPATTGVFQQNQNRQNFNRGDFNRGEFNRGDNRKDRNNNTVIAYPVYIGGYYAEPYIGSGDSGGAPPVQPNVTVVMPPQQAPVAPVIVNNYYPAGMAPPQQQPDLTQTVAPEESQTSAVEPTHYLIALKDHTIYNASAYWVDGDTLHYFTSGNTHNQVSLSLVDRDFTQRLNHEAGVDVKLPGK
jgi:hypothetical protein